MGASDFLEIGSGKNAKEAFDLLVEEACYEYGHGGYTGTIAEKNSFKIVSDKTFASFEEAEKFINTLYDKDDKRVLDKWGPALCVKFTDKNNTIKYIFFGSASC